MAYRARKLLTTKQSSLPWTDIQVYFWCFVQQESTEDANMTSTSAFQLRTKLTSSAFKHGLLKSRLPVVGWGTFDHFLLPGCKVTDGSNSLGQRHVIHKHRHKDLVLLQSAGETMQTKRAVITLHPTVLTFLPLVTCRRNLSPFVAKTYNPADVQWTLCATAARCWPMLLVRSTLRSPTLFALLHSHHALYWPWKRCLTAGG